MIHRRSILPAMLAALGALGFSPDAEAQTQPDAAPVSGLDAGPSDGGVALQPDGSPSGAPDAGPVPPIRAEGGHILLEFAQGVLRVTEVYVVIFDHPRPLSRAEPEDRSGGPDGGAETSDGGAETPDGGAEPSPEPWIRIPDGAGRIVIERGGELWAPVAGGIAQRAPIEPGRHPLAFSYLMRAEEGRAMVTHTLPFPVAGLHVLWPAGVGLSARAMGFTDNGTVQMGQRGMRVLERPMLSAGQQLVVITSIGEAAASAMGSREEPELRDPLGVLVPITLLLAGLLLVAGMLLPFKTRWMGRR